MGVATSRLRRGHGVDSAFSVHSNLAVKPSLTLAAMTPPAIIVSVLVEDFDYPLPAELIAQLPARERDRSRLMVLNRRPEDLHHRQFIELPELLRAGDVLIFNDSRVVPARLRARKSETGGQIEVLLAEEVAPLDWWVMLRPAKRVRPGTVLGFTDVQGNLGLLRAVVTAKSKEGLCRLRFEGTLDLFSELDRLGEVPLPPYIHRDAPGSLAVDRERYQTVFAETPGSVAAPTAGLHFTTDLLQRLHRHGIASHSVTLHVGLGTFAPVKTARVENHHLHTERYSVSTQTASAINEARREGRRVVAVGTTTVRVLEHVAAQSNGALTAGAGSTSIFLYPPATFRVVDALITNFHLPKSTLLMLVSAFAAPGALGGRERILQAYAQAVQHRYRFFSYGDAMLIQ